MKVTTAQFRKLDRLEIIYADKYGIAQTMRENLASDIKCGYGLANVVRQMVAIEEYEKTVVAAAKKELDEYREYINGKISVEKIESEQFQKCKHYLTDYVKWDSDEII